MGFDTYLQSTNGNPLTYDTVRLFSRHGEFQGSPNLDVSRSRRDLTENLQKVSPEICRLSHIHASRVCFCLMAVNRNRACWFFR